MIAQPALGGYRRATVPPPFRFPIELLGADEDLVLDLRPHWIALAKPFAQTLAILIATAVAFVYTPYRWGAGIFVLIGLVAVAAILAWPARALIFWATSHFVLTTDRVMRRSGLIARKSMEISLERITNVRFQETVLERMIGAGDLEIESAGSSGPVIFADIRKPERVQRTIFERKEANLARTRATGARVDFPFWAPPSVADELIKLNRLREDGVISETEFQALKSRLLDRV
jgi:membrane protein YdbS with pleckstrin-like domain